MCEVTSISGGLRDHIVTTKAGSYVPSEEGSKVNSPPYANAIGLQVQFKDYPWIVGMDNSFYRSGYLSAQSFIDELLL